MRSLRRVLASALFLPAALAPMASGPAQATGSDHVRVAHGTQKWRTIEAMVPVKTGPDRDVAIDLDTTLYKPRGATAKHPQPAILMTHGFGLDKDANEVVSTARFLAAHGYVVLTYTASGFGASGGCVTLQSLDYDVRSAQQLMTQVLQTKAYVKQDRRGAVVGTIGGSYGGGIQLPLASVDRRVRAAVVGRTWNDLRYSLDPNNLWTPGDRLAGFDHSRPDQGVFKAEWTSLFYALGNAQPAMGNGGCAQAKTASGDPTEIAGEASCPNFYLALCSVYEQLTATGDADDAAKALIARSSSAAVLGRVHAATLLVQGQSDTLFNLNDATSTYLALRTLHKPVGMIWNSGGHGGYSSQPGECEAYDGIARSVRRMDHCYLPLRALGWFDHYLRHRPGGRGPSFAYYRDWVRYSGHGPDDEQYGTARRVRLGGLTLTLGGQGRLATRPARAQVADLTMTNPPGGSPAAYSETSEFSGPDSSPNLAGPPTEVEGQHLDFTSKKMKRPLVVAGVPWARLPLVNTNGQDMVFFAKVYDVAPDGSTTLVHRLISPVRVPASEVGAPVRMRLAGFVHRFDRGHRLRLVLATTDQTSYNAKVADVLTLTTGPGATLTLPVR
ncbi:CocE/NonD family hydrolase [Nocardioides acrostichi]|uniref:CocE/NonD family hydrolase n=1 Tax=Nocardioides acrostichi TaxID=2784339 RepID=A0A930Y978_9ACTN|nr:CocE/NonD family hydrolase [Nocardioides acrostichi]MBF4160073.1 CocE/NonD family hydrolase [Nocardioides acrostichi]